MHPDVARARTRLKAAGALLAVLLLGLIGCASVREDTKTGVIAAAETYAATGRDRDAVMFIDIREPEETSLGVPRGVRTLSAYRLDGSRDAQFVRDVEYAVSGDHHKQIILICATGVRSAAARDLLKARGYTNVLSLAGGIRSWREQGLPVDVQVSPARYTGYADR